MNIRASCETCGDVPLSTGDVTVLVCAETGRGEYLFRCPRCRMATVKRAEPRTIEMLVAAGCHKRTWALPLELAERHEGDPIGPDDCLDFHQRLYDAEAFQAGLDEVFGEPA